MINQDKNIPNTIGGRIKAAREKEELTQTEFAKLLGYTSPTAISLIESDERGLKADTLQRIAEVLHQDVSYLTTGRQASVTVKTALRADESFDQNDITKIESFIDYLMDQKKKDGRGTN